MHVQVDPEAFAAAKDFVHRKMDGAEVSNSCIVNASLVFMGTSEKTMNAAFNERVEQEVSRVLPVHFQHCCAEAYADALSDLGIPHKKIMDGANPKVIFEHGGERMARVFVRNQHCVSSETVRGGPEN